MTLESPDWQRTPRRTPLPPPSLHAIGPNEPFPRPRPSTLAGHPGPHTLQPFRRIAVVLKELMGPPEHRLGVGLDRVERIAIVGMVGTFARVAHEYERAEIGRASGRESVCQYV